MSCECNGSAYFFSLTFSMSSQLVTMPCSMGYFRVRISRLLWASSPTYESFWPIPTITPWRRGLPTMEGKTARGASSPAKPALHIPEPLSTTKVAGTSSPILQLREDHKKMCMEPTSVAPFGVTRFLSRTSRIGPNINADEFPYLRITNLSINTRVLIIGNYIRGGGGGGGAITVNQTLSFILRK